MQVYEGAVVGRLTVVCRAVSNIHRHAMWQVECACGRNVVVRGDSLRDRRTRSCGGCNDGLQPLWFGRLPDELLSPMSTEWNDATRSAHDTDLMARIS